MELKSYSEREPKETQVLWRTSPTSAHTTQNQMILNQLLKYVEVLCISLQQIKIGRQTKNLSPSIPGKTPDIAEFDGYSSFWYSTIVRQILQNYDQPQKYKEPFLNFWFLIEVSKVSVPYRGWGEGRRRQKKKTKENKQTTTKQQQKPLSLNPGKTTLLLSPLTRARSYGTCYINKQRLWYTPPPKIFRTASAQQSYLLSSYSFWF